jgi:hypothetical protein
MHWRKLGENVPRLSRWIRTSDAAAKPTAVRRGRPQGSQVLGLEEVGRRSGSKLPAVQAVRAGPPFNEVVADGPPTAKADRVARRRESAPLYVCGGGHPLSDGRGGFRRRGPQVLDGERATGTAIWRRLESAEAGVPAVDDLRRAAAAAVAGIVQVAAGHPCVPFLSCHP